VIAPSERALMAQMGRKTMQVINDWWARSAVTFAIAAFAYYAGVVQTESRIAADCRFAAAFRVDIQAFTCQRKL
jgi:hypothetical protein